MGRMHGEHRKEFEGRRLADVLLKPLADQYLARTRPLVVVGPLCGCAMRPWPHDLNVHRQLAWHGDWRCLWTTEMRARWHR